MDWIQLVWRGRVGTGGVPVFPVPCLTLLGLRFLKSSGEHHMTAYRAQLFPLCEGIDLGKSCSCWHWMCHCQGIARALPGAHFLLLTLESHGVALGRLLGVLLLCRSKVHGSKPKHSFHDLPLSKYHCGISSATFVMVLLKTLYGGCEIIQGCSGWCWNFIFWLYTISHK